MRRPLLLVALAGLTLGSAACSSLPDPASGVAAEIRGGVSELEVQALVMAMADEYDAALGEVTYLILRDAEKTPRGRWLALSFLRNGTGASLDIAAGPNPGVALLDLLVLSSLQAWAFEAHWAPAAFDPEAGARAVARLRDAEHALWRSAADVLSERQLSTLRDLVAAWIAEHPDRTVVSLVRFSEFTQERELSTAGSRGRAAGLLREVGEATAAVEDARLFGERALWYASRYPYVLGQQSELSVYRMLDQPEVRELLATLDALGRAADALTTRAQDLESEEEALFARIAEERRATIRDARESFAEASAEAIDSLAARAAEVRAEAIDHLFRRLDEESSRLLDEMESREGETRALLAESRAAFAACAEAAQRLTATVETADRLVARFDHASDEPGNPLRLEDLRSTAVEAAAAAARLTELLEKVEEVSESGVWERRLEEAAALSTGLADALFLRGAALVALLVVGLGLVRLIPQRAARSG